MVIYKTDIVLINSYFYNWDYSSSVTQVDCKAIQWNRNVKVTWLLMVSIHFCVYLLCGMGSLCGGWGMVLNQLWYNSDLTYIGRHHVYKTAGLVDTGISASLCNWTKLFSELERRCDAACATIVSAPAALSDASPRINPRCVSCPRSPSEAL